MNHEEALWVDGKRLVAWLDSEHGIDSGTAALWKLDRRFREWKQGAIASIYTVDHVLTKLGLHLHDIPSDAFVEKRRRVYRRLADLSPEERAEAIGRCTAGERTSVVARSLGTSWKTIRNLVRSHGA